MQGPPLVQGATVRVVLDPTTIWDKPLFCLHVFKLIHIKLSKSPILGDVDHLASRELELSPAECFNHMLRILQLGMDGHSNLTNVDPGHCVLGLFATLTSLKPRFGDSMPVMNVHWKGLSPGLLRATWIGNRLHTLPRRLSAATQMHFER